MNLQAEKQALIHRIAAIEDAAIIQQVKSLLQSINSKALKFKSVEPDWVTISKEPMPESISLAKQQGYSSRRIDKTLKSWDYKLFEDQSLEELLNSLT
ncbi:MAG: hypothetical protein ACPG49_12660 [Chitinophagales bacterium]